MMIVRIVKLTIDRPHIPKFVANFDRNKEKIRSFEGCERLEFYWDRNDTSVFFTYSYWKDEEALETYRQSDLFKNVWAITKPMFKAKAEAWSVDKVVVLT